MRVRCLMTILLVVLGTTVSLTEARAQVSRSVLGGAAGSPTAELASTHDSLPGEPVECIDVGSGTPFAFRAQRLLFSGALDSLWAPDSGETCLGSAFGFRQPTVSDGAGGAYVGWTDTREGEPDIYLQRFDDVGAQASGWPLEGRAVCLAALSQYHLDLAADGAGGVYLAWEDFRSGRDGDVYLQHIDGSGDPAAGWPEGGRLVCSAPGPQATPRVAADGAGGAYVAWEDRRSGQPEIYVQRFDASGAQASGWPENGANLSSASGADVAPAILSLSDARVLVVWGHHGGPGAAELRACEVGSDGPNGSWPPANVALASDADEFGEVALAQRDQTTFAAWGEWRSGGVSLRVQRLSVEGAPSASWSAGGIELHSGEVGRSAPVLAPQPDGGVVVAWEDFRDRAQSDIYAQRLSAAGEVALGWPAAALAVCLAAGDQYGPLLSAPDSAGVIVTWADATANTSGAFLSASRGLTPRLLRATARPGHARIVWAGSARGPRSFGAQRRTGDADWQLLTTVALDDSVHLVLDDRAAPEGARVAYRLVGGTAEGEVFFGEVTLDIPRAPLILALHAAWAVPGERAFRVSLALPRGGDARLELMDVAGRRVSQQSLAGLEPGEHEVRFPQGGHLAAGVYFVRLLQDREARTAKVIYLK